MSYLLAYGIEDKVKVGFKYKYLSSIPGIKNSFSDSEIADLISYRFLAVILLSYPLGYFISFKRLKNFFLFFQVLLLPINYNFTCINDSIYST